MGTFIEEQKVVNVKTNQRFDTMESSLNKKLDGLQNDLHQKIGILQYSISRFTNQQHVHPEEENPEEECLIEITVEEHCKQQLQEELMRLLQNFLKGYLNSQTFALIFVHHC